MQTPPGAVRDAIVEHLAMLGTDVPIEDIYDAVCRRLGLEVAPSSVRSYLNLNTPTIFERVGRGRYRLVSGDPLAGGVGSDDSQDEPVFDDGRARLYRGDCFSWLARQPERSFQAIVTDPPYGLVEYSETEQAKLVAGRGGVWRIPPSFDGHKRAPLPRFTVLGHEERLALRAFFKRLAILIHRAAVPGANVVVASNPLLAHVVAGAMTEGGLELRGYLVRLVMTMRGGDRPKNAHREFTDVSVMPRSMWEPWIILRTPLEGRVQDNLRKWGTGGFRRLSEHKPFGDVIKSNPTPRAERKIAPHPSLKPQAFLRQIVRASLPLGSGVVVDPFAGSGSTLAASSAVGYRSIGVEKDPRYAGLAREAIPRLASIKIGSQQPEFDWTA
ncbi:MAG TPA: DNA methyltransferase [Hyphomicrobiales bacterium]|nr:DNA methyltransferase [Hyphomicrobiales bacterium]